MYKRFVTLGAIVISFGCMSGCAAPDYINDAPTSVVESLQMTQADTALKLNKICNNVISSSGTLEQQTAKYLDKVAKSSLDDKNAIINSILTNIDIVKRNITEVKSFNPATALKQRASDITLKLNDAEAYLRSLKDAVESDDVDMMSESFNNYMQTISALKTLSTGM